MLSIFLHRVLGGYRGQQVAGKGSLPKRPKELSIQREKRGRLFQKKVPLIKAQKKRYTILQGANNSLWRKNTEMKPKVGQETIMNHLVYGILRSFSFIVSSRWVKKLFLSRSTSLRFLS